MAGPWGPPPRPCVPATHLQEYDQMNRARPLRRDDPEVAALAALPTEKRGDAWESMSMIKSKLIRLHRVLLNAESKGLVHGCTLAKLELLQGDIDLMMEALHRDTRHPPTGV